MFEIIKNWLTAHSISIERHGSELRFKHSETESSILVMTEGYQDVIPAGGSPLLIELYRHCAGASIGNGHIIIGSSINGGIKISHGYRLPDLEELRSQAKSLGMVYGDQSEAFMMVACWLFIYGVTPHSERLVCFDREFGTYETISNVENVLNDWWQIAEADGAVNSTALPSQTPNP
jgi:hypothetical protein